jgi:hypothetical protein
MDIGSSNITPNTYPLILTSPLTGNFNTIFAIGGFNITQTLPIITIDSSDNIIQNYNLTDTVQIIIDVNRFNSKLGDFNPVTNMFQNDTIVYHYNEFVQDVSSINQIVSVGRLSTLYIDFSNFVNIYFNSGSGLNSILSSTTSIPGSNVFFDASAFINVIQTGSLSGRITIKNVNLLLQYALDSNVFGNRSPSLNVSISDGFKDGDLILIYPSIINPGISVLLDLSLDTSQLLLNTSNPSYPFSYKTNDPTINGTTTINDADITRIKVTRSSPLLFILKDLS